MSGRILLSGYYGLGNAGDEAVLEASVALFRRQRPGIPISVLSASPAETARRLRVEAVPRMAFPLIGRELKRSSLFLSGGGSLLQDRTSLKSLLYYLALIEWAQRLGLRTMVFAQGIGPLVRPAARTLTARVLSRVDAITVRDADSLELLREIGLREGSGPEITVTADPVFALPPRESPKVDAATPARPSVAVSLRPWPGVEGILEPLAEVLRGYEGRLTRQAWPLFPGEDRPLCEALAARVPGMTVLNEELEPAEWMALAGRTDVVVGMRLHALIFAAARAVPVVGISYDPKVDALLGRLRSRPAGTAASLDPAALRSAIDAALAGDPKRKADRTARAEHLRDLAGRNVETALRLLDRK
jgi:polysaccharide pyruvyl transferase CsaB